MSDVALIDIIANDGSRQFLAVPQTLYADDLAGQLQKQPAISNLELLFSIPESWIEFDYRGYHFSINDQFGEFWCFVKKPTCPDDVLLDFRDMLVTLLG